MSHHILVIEPDPQAPAMGPHHSDDRQWTIECPPGNGCNGWMECDKAHEVEGYGSADGGPEQCDPNECTYPEQGECTTPWADAEEFEFHGVMHEWKGGHGWTVPYVGCIVAGSDVASPPDGMDELPYGRYPIEDDWDDTEVALDFIHPIPGRCPSNNATSIGWARWCERPEGHTGHHAAGNWGWEHQ